MAGPADGAHVPDAAAHHQRVERGRHLVRRQPHRQRRHDRRVAGRLPHLLHADPDGRDDGHVRGDHGAPRRGVRRAHRRGARHRAVGRRRRPTRSPTSATPGSLELRDVGFRYPGAEAPVLDGISFTSLAGQTTAVIGSTGAGKTTLVNLVARLVDVTSGSVSVDGVDIRDMRARRRCGAASAWSPRSRTCSPARWPATCATASPTPPTRRSGRRCAVAQAADFVAAMPGGLDAPIAQGGTNVSGGQRQRLAIARALVKKPEIYLFDDSFSALDLATDARLRAALAPYVAGRHGDDRRPAGVDDRHGRPDPRARGRPAGRPRHPRRAARDLPHLRRDRGLAGGQAGGGVSTTTSPAARAPSGDGPGPATPGRAEAGRPAAPGPRARSGHGRRHAAARSPATSATRRRGCCRCCAATASASAGRRPGGRRRRRSPSLGPKILGHATDIVIEGFLSPGGIDFAELHRVLGMALGCCSSARRRSPTRSAYLLAGHRAAHHAPPARRRRGQAQPPAAVATSTASRAATCSAGSPTTSTTSPRACSRRSASCSPRASRWSACSAMMISISPCWRWWRSCRSRCRSSRSRASPSGRRPASSPSGPTPACSTPRSRRRSPATPSSRRSAASARSRTGSASTNDELYEASFAAQFISGMIQPAMMFLGNLNYVVIAVLGGLRVDLGGHDDRRRAGVPAVHPPVHPCR